jgi:lipoprotein NlpI
MDASFLASPALKVVRRCVVLAILCTTVHAQEPATPAPLTAPAAQTDREIQLAAEAFVKDPKMPRWAQPHAVPDSKTAGAAVLVLSDSQVLVGDTPVEFTHRAAKINDPSVLSSIGRLSLAFVPAYQRMVLHTLQVIRDGVVVDRLAGAQVRFLQREAGLENNLYNGIVTASILIDDLRVGDTLEVAFSTIGLNPVFGAMYSGAQGWDQGLAIDERRIIVNAPVQRRIAWKTHGVITPAIAAPSDRTVDGIRTLIFEGQSIAALPPEPSVPSGVSIGRWIEFSEYTSWNGVATWAAGLFVDTEPPSPERVKLVATLMAKPTVEERVVGALEFVQSQIRYFSVSLGTSSHRPTLPNTVLTRRYGDCKDKSLLLVTLLRDMGIASTPALARLGNRTGFDDRLPTPIAFDHVIVKVDVDGVPWFLDATRMGQHGRLARMGQVHDGSQVLLASAATQGLTRIDVPNRADLALEERIEKMALPKFDGDATLEVTMIQNGVSAEALRMIRGVLPQDRLETLLTADMEKRYTGVKIVGPVRIDDDTEQNRVTMTYSFSVPKPATRAGSGWRVAFKAENMQSLFTVPTDPKRRGPVVVRYPVNAHYTFETTFPEEVAAAFDPSSTTVKDPVFTSTSELSFRGNRSVAKAEIRTNADRIALADLPTLRDDLQKFQRSFPGAVVVRDADIKKSGFLGIGRKDLATTIRTRQENIVSRISATLKSGRLSGSDLARAYCDRGAAFLTLDQPKEALADAEKAVEVDPDAPDMLVCRGEIKLGTRGYAAAIDDLSRAVVMGSESGRAYYLRGQAKFFLGRYADAAADFAKAGTVDRDERSTMQYDLWRAMAFRRMDKPLPDDLQQRAATDPRGEWPRPALAMLADRLVPDEVGPLAAKKPGDTAELNGTEADFYLGEFFLARGDVAKARDAFTASRARGVIIYTEYVASGIELDRLGAKAP